MSRPYPGVHLGLQGGGRVPEIPQAQVQVEGAPQLPGGAGGLPHGPPQNARSQKALGLQGGVAEHSGQDRRRLGEEGVASVRRRPGHFPDGCEVQGFGVFPGPRPEGFRAPGLQPVAEGEERSVNGFFPCHQLAPPGGIETRVPLPVYRSIDLGINPEPTKTAAEVGRQKSPAAHARRPEPTGQGRGRFVRRVATRSGRPPLLA